MRKVKMRLVELVASLVAVGVGSATVAVVLYKLIWEW